MNLIYPLIEALIKKYEIGNAERKKRLDANPNDCAEGVLIGYEMVVADLKSILNQIKKNSNNLSSIGSGTYHKSWRG